MKKIYFFILLIIVLLISVWINYKIIQNPQKEIEEVVTKVVRTMKGDDVDIEDKRLIKYFYDFNSMYRNCSNVKVKIKWKTEHDEYQGYIYIAYKFEVEFQPAENNTLINHGSSQAVWTIKKRDNNWEITNIDDNRNSGNLTNAEKALFSKCPEL